MNKPKLALIFDLDDTLYARKDPFYAAVCQFVQEKRPDLAGALEKTEPEALYRAFVEYGYDLYEQSMTGEVSMEEMYIYRMSHALGAFAMPVSDAEALEIQQMYFWHQEHIRLDVQLQEVLEAGAGEDVFLGIISNGKSDHQRDKYRVMGLGRWIPEENFMASGDIGISKPDPRIFEEAIRRWPLPEGNTWYIGDSYRHDIEASAPFGWHGIWLNRAGEALPQGAAVRPDHTVRTTGELKDVLLLLCHTCISGRSPQSPAQW